MSGGFQYEPFTRAELAPYATKAEMAAAMGAYLPKADQRLVYSWANTAIPAAITAQTKTAFAVSPTIPGGLATANGSKIVKKMWGHYTAPSALASIVPLTELGGIALVPSRTITGLLGSANNPWRASEVYVKTDAGWVGGGVLYVDDNVFRLIQAPSPIAGPDMTQPQTLISYARWMQANCSITLHGKTVEVFAPAA